MLTSSISFVMLSSLVSFCAGSQLDLKMQTHHRLSRHPGGPPRGFREKGYLFSGIWGEGSFIFRDGGESITFGGFREREQGAEENILGSWGERSFFFQGAGSKDPPPGGLIQEELWSYLKDLLS